MRYPFLTSALALVFGGASALAQANPAATQGQQQQPQHHQQQQSSATPTSDMKSSVQDVDVMFDTDSAKLDDAKSAELQQLADFAKCDSRNAIILEGHADPRGSKAHNLKLSGERAAAVREKLIELGVPSNRIVVTIYGENGEQRKTLAEDRRVTARSAETPVSPGDLSG
jgi:peptidoglycan-associated lipoprotein